MLPGSLPPLLQAAAVSRDTIVALTMPAERTAFDLASGTLQILVLLVGLVALLTMAVSAIALRQAVHAVREAVDRLATDARPLLAQATRASEDAREVIALVRTEAEKVAAVTGEVSARLLAASDEAADRLDRLRALVDVLQREVEETTLSAAASVRGWRVGATALGAALTGRGRRRGGARPLPDDDAFPDDGADDDRADDGDAGAGLAPDPEDDLDDRRDPRERPYFT